VLIVVLDRARRHRERAGDLLVGQPAHEEAQDVDLAIGEAGGPGLARARARVTGGLERRGDGVGVELAGGRERAQLARGGFGGEGRAVGARLGERLVDVARGEQARRGLERGDADVSYDLPNKDFVELKDGGKLNIVSMPYSNGIQYLGMNVTKPPFNNPKVRQAVAYAVPYQKIMDAVLFGLAKPMFGAAGKPTEAVWPQPHMYNTDIAKAKALLTEAGYPDGFETTLSFDLGFAGVNEPLCVLVQESLAQIGIKTTINKIPGANWRTELTKKTMPLYTNVFSGWLDYPEYFFIWCYHGRNSIFNTMGYQSKEMDAFIDGAVAAGANGDKPTYDTDVKGFIDLAFTDMPRIPLYQPYVNVAMQKRVSGYEYWFHRRLDYRAMTKA